MSEVMYLYAVADSDLVDADVTDVRGRLHGEAAHVDTRPTLLEGDEVAHLPRGGVVEAESHRPILRARRPADCHSYVTGEN